MRPGSSGMCWPHMIAVLAIEESRPNGNSPKRPYGTGYAHYAGHPPELFRHAPPLVGATAIAHQPQSDDYRKCSKIRPAIA